MRARTLLTALVLLPLVTAGAQAQSYTIKIKAYPAAGKSFGVVETGKLDTLFSLALGDTVLKEDKKIETEDKRFTEKIVEAGTDRPQKFTRTYSKAAKGKDGELDKLSYDGKTIVFTRKGNQYEVTAEGDGVDAKDLADLAKQVNRKPDDVEKFAPKDAVKVGDTWKISAEVFKPFLADFKDGADTAGLKATGKLVKAYKKDGQQWGTLDIAMSVPVKKVGPLPLDTPITFALQLTLDTPIDGSSMVGQMKGSATFKGMSAFTQNDMAFQFNIAVAGVFSRAQTAEK